MTERILSLEEGRRILRAKASHKEIQSAIEHYLRVQKIPCSSTDAAASYNRYGQIVRRVEKGWPDDTACLPPHGRMFAIEVKAGRDKLRPKQAKTLYDLYRAGALVVIARSLDDVIEVLATRRTRQKDLDEIIKYKDRPERRRNAAPKRVRFKGK